MEHPDIHTISEELCECIRSRDSSRLLEFKQKYPEISPDYSFTVGCSCGCDLSTSFRKMLTDMGSSPTPNEFIDTLFDCGYLLPTDAKFLAEYTSRINNYSGWDTAMHILEKLDVPNAISYYEVCEAGTEYEYVMDLERCAFWSTSYTYYGKIHGSFARYRDMLISRGIRAHMSDGSIIENYKSDFFDSDTTRERIAWFKNEHPDIFDSRNVEYWDSLPGGE